MYLKIILISRLCWEILDENSILKGECSNLNQFRKNIRKLYKGMKLKHYEIYFRYSLNKFIKVYDQYSYKVFFNMDATKVIYMFLLDCDSYMQGTRYFLSCLDAKDLQEEEYENRSKYDVEMMEPDIVCMDDDVEIPIEKEPTTSEIIKHAIRHIEQDECFNMDMLLRYRMISALKEGFDLEKDSLITFPSSDIKFEKLLALQRKADKRKSTK
ncbi:uncharacterized protein LOC123307681 [Coccinella septempunctata]|uniref:uncharacterized protein LOC123307681 n=1 Tax=Coccinella septempunctata TaxID=41139 RepID=UPI001D05C5CC|nr:uncharacterized protein LOC123307681 [Coccinella septempunctata]